MTTSNPNTFMAVSIANHQNYGYASENPFGFAADWPFIELSSAELSKVIGLMPMVFQKLVVNDQTFYRYGLATGLGNQNCLVHPKNGKFLLPYVPAVLRAYPFKMVKADAQSDQQVLAVMQSEVDQGFAKGNGDSIIEEGGLSEKGKALLNFLGQLNQRGQLDQKALAAIVESGILVPINLQVRVSEDSEETQAARTDLYRVDEKLLQELDAEVLANLQKTGAMAFVYAHLFSMDKLANFQKMIEVYAQLQQQAQSEDIDLEKMFDDDDSDVLKF